MKDSDAGLIIIQLNRVILIYIWHISWSSTNTMFCFHSDITAGYNMYKSGPPKKKKTQLMFKNDKRAQLNTLGLLLNRQEKSDFWWIPELKTYCLLETESCLYCMWSKPKIGRM